ncbi:MAG: hypothetical protein ACR2H1_05235, partial [Limisphaerales bacterium]
GLLFAKEKLQHNPFTASDADFVGRNQAKAQLAFGDVVLVAHGQYHFSCRERNRRLGLLAPEENLPWLNEVRRHHAQGVEFKLHPQKKNSAKNEFEKKQRELSDVGWHLWRWLENRRLHRVFISPRDYALSRVNKCPETHAFRNRLANFKNSGLASIFKKDAAHYPRERILNTLPLLLWEPDALPTPELLQKIQSNLQTSATDFTGIMAAYRSLWRHCN